LSDPEFSRGEIFMRWLDERLPQLLASGEHSHERDRAAEDAVILAALLHHAQTNGAGAAPVSAEPQSVWKREARLEQVDRGE